MKTSRLPLLALLAAVSSCSEPPAVDPPRFLEGRLRTHQPHVHPFGDALDLGDGMLVTLHKVAGELELRVVDLQRGVVRISDREPTLYPMQGIHTRAGHVLVFSSDDATLLHPNGVVERVAARSIVGAHTTADRVVVHLAGPAPKVATAPEIELVSWPSRAEAIRQVRSHPHHALVDEGLSAEIHHSRWKHVVYPGGRVGRWRQFYRRVLASEVESPVGTLYGLGELLFSIGSDGDLWAWSTLDASYQHFESLDHFKASERLHRFRRRQGF